MRIKSPYHFLLIALFIISSCHHADINDPSKRNENWVWWVDKATGVGKWIPVADQTTVKDGDYTTFYTNGKTYSHGKLRNSKPVDTTYFYNYDSVMVKYAIISKDTSNYYSINGNYIGRYQNGNAQEVGIVENHKRGDYWVWYNKNGFVSSKRDWTDGTGWSMTYYQSGQVKDSAHYLEGVPDGLSIKWFESGQLHDIANWKNNKQDGECIFYHENGMIDTKSTWKDGQLNGLDSCWYASGQLQFVHNYKNGKKDGDCKSYYENGHLRLDYNYKNDLLDGPMLNYYPNGQVSQDFRFENGVRVGDGRFYFQDGRLHGSDHFTKEQLEGKRIIYYQNGKVGAIGIIINGTLPDKNWQYYDSNGAEVKSFPKGLQPL